MVRRDCLDLEDTGRRMPDDGPYGGHPILRLRGIVASPSAVAGRGYRDRGIAWSRVEESHEGDVPGCVTLNGRQGSTCVVEGVTPAEISARVAALREAGA